MPKARSATRALIWLFATSVARSRSMPGRAEFHPIDVERTKEK
jgi:hypothetical protein